MKKIFALALSALSVVFLCSCGDAGVQKNPTDSLAQTISTVTATEEPTSATVPAPTEDAPPAPGASDACTHLWGQWTEHTKATCQTTGTRERVCLNCNTVESQILKMTDHAASDWIIESVATASADGLKYKKCVYCNKRLAEEKLAAIQESHRHKVDQWVVVKAADCTNDGSQNGICACGQIMETKTISKLDHTLVTDQAQAATCTTNGLTEGKHCSVCNTVLVAQTVIPANGHSMSSRTVAATATKGAHKLYFCANCTYSYEEPIDFTALLKFESKNDGTCRVTGLKDKTVTDLIIPRKSPAGDTVTAIGSEAFANNKVLESLVLPDTVTRIMYDAFYNCSNLKTVEFPQNGAKNLELDYQCFAFCGIEKLDLTKTTIDTIGSHAFYGCKNLKTVTLGAVTTIDNFAFTTCTELKSLIHAGNLVTIGERSFEGCKKLTELRAKDSQHNLDTIEVFSSHSFYGSGIRDIVFSKKLKGTNKAFEGCINLGTVDFSQVSDKFASFVGSKIDKIIFPSSLSRIPDTCFSGATLGNITLPDSVTEIGNNAFLGATISKITFGSGLVRIGDCAFKNAKASYNFSKVRASLSIGYEAFANNTFTSFAFPKSTVYIGAGALMGCSKLKTLSIPFIGKDSDHSSASTQCFAWLFGKDVDCWNQSSAVPSSLKTVILHGEDPDVRDFLGVKISAIVIGKDVTSIANENFGSDSTLTRIYYEGTQQEWEALPKGSSNNQKLSAAEVYFYSETEPATEGRFWHFDGSTTIVVWES